MSYTATVTLDTDRAERMSRNFGMIVGKCNISSYNTTGVEITGITKYFIDDPRVIADGVSSNGYLVRWDTTDKCFHAFYPKPATSSTVTIAGTGGTAGADNTLIKTSDTAIAVAGTGTACTAPISGQGALAGSEVVNDVDVGEINFVAIGII